MKPSSTARQRTTIVVKVSALLLAGATLTSGVGPLPASSAPARAAGTTNRVNSVSGTCNFGGTPSAWSATLTPKGPASYDAVYSASWGGNTLKYVGTIDTDAKTKINGKGSANDARGNGTFEFSGKYGTNGIAQCSYKEVGGNRSGAMTIELPKYVPATATTNAPSKTSKGAATSGTRRR